MTVSRSLFPTPPPNEQFCRSLLYICQALQVMCCALAHVPFTWHGVPSQAIVLYASLITINVVCGLGQYVISLRYRREWYQWTPLAIPLVAIILGLILVVVDLFVVGYFAGYAMWMWIAFANAIIFFATSLCGYSTAT